VVQSRHWKGGPISDLAQLLEALQFAAHKHRAQRRKDADASPYINHPLEVATILATTGAINDLATLLAAVLHDTIEDTETTPEELEKRFGPEVRSLVLEVTDDKRLPKEERKLGDKIANVHDVTATPPADWSRERRRDYLDWTEQVVRGCRGSSPALERRYDEALRSGRAVLEARPRGPNVLTE
jgi:guanosine-3',5'-bis(diphosphate) 3'-pyrophosphohydrolase